MPHLTFMEELKDKASRLITSAYTGLVEEATSERHNAPFYESLMIICDQANSSTNHVTDIVRAVRRRIDSHNPKIQYFTVVLLDMLIKNCYEDIYVEVAETKALLRELVNIATNPRSTHGVEVEAKKVALTLILNMEAWFKSSTNHKTRSLTLLADEVRQKHPLAFDNITSDSGFVLKKAPPTHQHSVQQRSYVPNYNNNNQRRTIVNAIPVHQYSGEQISAMLEACSILNECLNESESKGTLKTDEHVHNVALQVKNDHRKLALLVGSGAEMENIDVLLTVSDSQTSVLRRLAAILSKQGNTKEAAEFAHTANIELPHPEIASATICTSSDEHQTVPVGVVYTSVETHKTSTVSLKGARRADGEIDFSQNEEMKLTTSDTAPINHTEVEHH